MSAPALAAELRSPDVTLEEFLWLIDGGEDVTRAARRVGTTLDALGQHLRRRGIDRPAVHAELARQAAKRNEQVRAGLITSRARKRQPNRETMPDRCRGRCDGNGQGRPLWRYPEQRVTGAVKHAGGGYCSTCRSRLVARGEWKAKR